jgi:hypothetical protein
VVICLHLSPRLEQPPINLWRIIHMSEKRPRRFHQALNRQHLCFIFEGVSVLYQRINLVHPHRHVLTLHLHRTDLSELRFALESVPVFLQLVDVRLEHLFIRLESAHHGPDKLLQPLRHVEARQLADIWLSSAPTIRACENTQSRGRDARKILPGHCELRL